MKKDYIPFTDAEMRLIEKINNKRVVAETRFPLITALAATFGFVSVLYGFEKMIDNIDFLANNPIVLLVLGMVVLLVTGTAYKKLN